MPKPAASYKPAGAHTVNAYLTVADADQAIAFYTKAFGASEQMRMPGPDGKIAHATLTIGDATVYLCEEMMSNKAPTTLGGTAVTLHMYVPDADATWKAALDAGAKIVMPLDDMFWGDRYGIVSDPSGHLWAISTQKESLTPDEMAERARTAMSQQG
jgi:PhnB protein